MSKGTIVLVSAIALFVAVGLFLYFSAFDIHESRPPDMPKVPGTSSLKPDFDFDKKTRKPITVQSAAGVQNFLNKTVPYTGYPVHIERVVFVSSGNANEKIREIVHNTVLPNMHGRVFKAFIVFNRHCEANEPCASQRQIADPSQLGWSETAVHEYLLQVETLVRRIGISDDDRIYQVDWVTDDGGRFYTIFVTDQNNVPKFEPILWFSPANKNCSEHLTPRGPQESTLSWDGKVINGFGFEVVKWNGEVTYHFENGKFLTKDFCPAKCLSYSSEFLWEVDSDSTKVSTDSVQGGPPEEATLHYQVAWSLWFPTKVNAGENVGVEMPPPKGNMVAGNFAIRADGTFNKE